MKTNYPKARELMVERQIARRGIKDDYVLRAMRRVPRQRFVPDALREFAYEDSPLPIEAGQTISQPYIVARMVEAARIRPGDRVLEIGGGSGYAAAVIATIAAHVFVIERHEVLANLARRRLKALGYRNAEVRTGDGSGGWREAAPFDAILAAAGAPSIPETLVKQLAPGGRLVMPVGDTPHRQRLVKVTRGDDGETTREDLGEVLFVPLIGEQGWPDPTARAPHVEEPRKPEPDADTQLLRKRGIALPALDDEGFGACFDRFATARVVLLGEASHGTAEFYAARAAISRRLIQAHGFALVAIEADWPDAAVVDRYVRHLPVRSEPEGAFARFPTWMWRNAEFAAFVEWLRGHNATREPAQRVGVCGLDLYSLQRSIRAVVDYLDRVDPEAARVARHRYGCLMPWAREPAEYGRMALSEGYGRCEKAVLEMLQALLERQLQYGGKDGESFLDAAQNARLVRDAEAYYRAMYYGAAESWNLRDRHMFETLQHALGSRGKDAKAVVWAHNSHVGDARHTEMGWTRGELNIGQLCRESYGEQVATIGFGTHGGTVAVADDWDGPMRIMDVVPSLTGSYERLFHDADVSPCLYDLRAATEPELHGRLSSAKLERFIGVIYRPRTERWSHYAEAALARQFDAFAWFDRTHAVHALAETPGKGMPDTYPFGL